MTNTGALETADPFELANIFPRSTGLPMTVWIGPRGNARHDVRVKVCQVHGQRMDADNLAVMAVRPEPKLIAGDLSVADQRAVARWIDLNRDVILAVWNGELDPTEIGPLLRKV